MKNNNPNKESLFNTVLSQSSEVLNQGVTVNVAFDYLSTAYLALALFIGILFAMVASGIITQQITQPSKDV